MAGMRKEYDPNKAVAVSVDLSFISSARARKRKPSILSISVLVTAW